MRRGDLVIIEGGVHGNAGGGLVHRDELLLISST